MKVGGRHQKWYAHVVSYVLAHGSVPEGKHVHHRCRTTMCVNPDHLEAVTPREHAIAHDRGAISDALAAELRRLNETEGLGKRRLAKRFGVPVQGVGALLYGTHPKPSEYRRPPTRHLTVESIPPGVVRSLTVPLPNESGKIDRT
jgi:hypothetical protein